MRPAKLLLSSFVSATLTMPVPAFSQQIEEIVVTARKREETLQEVPMAVSAIDGLQIEKVGIRDVEDLYARVPGLYFSNVGSAGPNEDFQYLVIRGVGFNGGLEPAVGVFVDGMYMPQIGFDLSFLDVERVEVLRGPQGTLFGRNTQAGALNIVTRKPGDAFRATAETEVAEFGTYRLRGAASGPLSDSFYAGVNVEYGQTDGFIDNVVQDTEQDFTEQFTARLNLRYSPRDDLGMSFVADVSNKEFRDPGTSVLLDGREEYESFADQDTDDTKDLGGAQISIDWDINDTVMFTSLTGFRTADSQITYDPDFNVSDQTPITLSAVTESTSIPTVPIDVAPQPIGIEGVTHDTGIEQDFFSQEIQLSGSGEQIDWLGGLYYFDQSMLQTRKFDIGPGIPFVPLYIRESFTEDRDGYAAFGQVSYRPGTSWEITAGARYSQEDVETGGQRVLNISDASIFAFPKNGRTDYDDVSLMGSVSYAFTDAVNTYLTYAEGWKAGGINRFPSRNNATLPYDSEESTNVEVGLKATWLDGRLTTNAAIYTIDIKGQQVLTVVPDPAGATPVTIIDNAADSTSRGVELELTARLHERLDLDVAFAHTDTEFDEYFLNDGAGVPTVDKSGDEFAFVPNETGSATLTWSAPLQRNANLEVSVNYRYVGGYAMQDGNFNAPLGAQLDIPSYDRLDVRATLERDDWRFTGYVKNLADSFDYNNIARDPFLLLDATPFYVTPLAPRQIGVVVTRSF